MLIHGAWLSARSRENFAGWFGERGYAVSTPEWPRKDGDVERLRANAEALRGLGLKEIVDHHETLIRELGEAAGVARPLVRRPDRGVAARPRTGSCGDRRQ